METVKEYNFEKGQKVVTRDGTGFVVGPHPKYEWECVLIKYDGDVKRWVWPWDITVVE